MAGEEHNQKTIAFVLYPGLTRSSTWPDRYRSSRA
jgi:hypothetical protein